MFSRTKREKAPFPSPIFILATIVLFMVGYGFYRFGNFMINESTMFELKNIQVIGNKFLEENEILSQIDVRQGTKLFNVNTNSIADNIMKNKYLEGVSVRRSMPSTLIISVQERQPVAFLIDGKVYMVDKTAILLLKKPKMMGDDLPFITGLDVAKLLENRKPLLEVLELLKKVNEVDPGLLQFISEIHVDAGKTPCFYLIRGGAMVELGRENPFQKIYLLSEFIKSNRIINQLNQIKKIDLKFSDRIVVTKKS
jgi:cell division protein FtsQ